MDNIKRETVSIRDVIDGKAKSPIPLEVIPNTMGINLCSVDSVSSTRLPDGQLVDLTIAFLPNLSK